MDIFLYIMYCLENLLVNILKQQCGFSINVGCCCELHTCQFTSSLFITSRLEVMPTQRRSHLFSVPRQRLTMLCRRFYHQYSFVQHKINTFDHPPAHTMVCQQYYALSQRTYIYKCLCRFRLCSAQLIQCKRRFCSVQNAV